jgi:very-short-patch-repair endonuclease
VSDELPLHHPQTPSSEEEEEKIVLQRAPSSLEEGVGGGGVSPETLHKRARAMRNIMTEPERRLWMALRSSRLTGHKFPRQDVIGQRIVDFFCPSKGLVIEVDGDTHDAELDQRRDRRMLVEFGFETRRFTNSEIMTNLEGVVEHLASVLDQLPDRWPGRRKHHPQTPSSEKEGA